MDALFSNLIAIVGVMLTFGIAVCVHEFGHMVFALIRGVGVESFAIGMGPRICAWHWRGIEFSLRWLPVGGFVKLHSTEIGDEPGPGGEAIPDGPEPEKKDLAESSYDDLNALENKGFLTKVLVFGGGVFMNFVSAVAVTALLLWLPQEFPLNPLLVDHVAPQSPALATGFEPGDKIVALNGEPVIYTEDLFEELAALAPAGVESGQTISFEMTVERNGEQLTLESGPLDGEGLNALFGRDSLVFFNPPVLRDVHPMMPASKADLEAGDRILSIQGEPIESAYDVVLAIKKAGVEPLAFMIERDGQTVECTLTPQADPTDPAQPKIGVEFSSDVTEKRQIYANPLVAVYHAPGATLNQIAYVVKQQRNFFKKAGFKEVREGMGGPIAIMAITGSYAKKGLVPSLEWFVLLNILLIIFNLLPIPVLDGGFILIAMIEAVIRRPVPPKLLNPIFTFSMVVLIGFVVLVSINDVLRWFGG